MDTSPLLRHRFGVNYTPGKDWYYCWNDFDPDAVARDFDAIAALGADHVRVMLLWPYFQPNPHWVSEAHLARFDRLMALAGERDLMVCPALLNGWLSGYSFVPPGIDRERFLRFGDGLGDARPVLPRRGRGGATTQEFPRV